MLSNIHFDQMFLKDCETLVICLPCLILSYWLPTVVSCDSQLSKAEDKLDVVLGKNCHVDVPFNS